MGELNLGPLVGIMALIALAIVGVLVWYIRKIIKEDNKFGWIIVAIVIAIIGFYIWRIM